jgi:hypothetical protein
MSSSAIGLVFLLIFALSQGMRDALFGNAFQSISFFLVAALAFGASTLCFSGLALLLQPEDFTKLATSPARFAALNVLTAVAKQTACERLMIVRDIGGCIRARSGAGCGDAGVGKVG